MLGRAASVSGGGGDAVGAVGGGGMGVGGPLPPPRPSRERAETVQSVASPGGDRLQRLAMAEIGFAEKEMYAPKTGEAHSPLYLDPFTPTPPWNFRGPPLIPARWCG